MRWWQHLAEEFDTASLEIFKCKVKIHYSLRGNLNSATLWFSGLLQVTDKTEHKVWKSGSNILPLHRTDDAIKQNKTKKNSDITCIHVNGGGGCTVLHVRESSWVQSVCMCCIMMPYQTRSRIAYILTLLHTLNKQRPLPEELAMFSTGCHGQDPQWTADDLSSKAATTN